MIDIRYHIYSLAAVFFALAIGIVVGVSFGKPSIGSGERQTITRYENSMRVLKREIENAADDAARKKKLAADSEAYCKAVLPIVVKNKLAWHNVAIVQTGDYDDLTGSVKQALELAGARVTSVTDISRNYPFYDESKIASTLAKNGVATPPNAGQAREKLFNIIAGTVRDAQHPELLPGLEESGIAKFTGDFNRPNKMIVFVGGALSRETDSSQVVDAELIARLDRIGVVIVGCENTTAAASYVPTWHKAGIATVDNADSAIGQVALICALAGEKAQYGIKDTADRLIPQTLEKR